MIWYLTARLVDGDLALELDLDPVLQVDAHAIGIAAEQHAGHLGAGIFECEVDVPGPLLAQVGDLALQGDRADLQLEEVTDLPRQLGDADGP